MKGKKISTSILAAVMLAGTTAMPVLAAMPDETVVIGEKAFSISYANDEANFDAIGDLVTEAGGEGIYVKFGNEWYDNMTGETITDLSPIPAVVYTADGTEEVSYEAQDGDEATEGFMIEEVSAVGVKKVKVVFSEEVDTDEVTFQVKKGTSIKSQDEEKIAWNEEKSEATITLANHKIGDGDYSVKVMGVELEEDTATFKGEKERVDEIQIVGDKTPLKNNKVAVEVRVLNQYGDKTNGDISVVTSFGNEDITTTKVVKVTVPESTRNLIENGQLKDYEYIVTALDTKSGETAKANLKVVKEAIATEVVLGDVYAELVAKDKEMKVVEITAKNAAQKAFVKVELKDQYGNILNRDYFANIAELNSHLDGINTYKLTTVYDKGTTGVDSQYVFNENNSDDKNVYLELNKEYKDARLDETIFFVIGSTVARKTIDIKEARTTKEINFSLPELVVKGEKNVIEDFSATDKNGDDYTGEALAAVFNDTEAIDTNGNGVFAATYDAKTEKVSLVWDLRTVSDEDEEDVTIITVRTGTLEIDSRTARMKPAAKPVEVRMESSKVRKLLKGTETKVKLSDMVVSDQYERTMSTAKVANENLIRFGSVTDNVFSGTERTKIENNDGDIVDGYWTQAASGEFETVDMMIKIHANDKFEGATARFKTVKDSEVVALKVSEVTSLYGESNDSKYAKDFIVEGKTSNGEIVALNNSHYGITTTNVVVANGKVVVKDGLDFTDNKDKSGSVVVISRLSGNNIDAVVRSITLEHENPVRTNMEIRDGEEIQYVKVTTDDTTLTVAELLKLIKVTDQYGLEESYANEVTNIVLLNKTGDFVDGIAGGKTGDITVLENGDSFDVKMYFGAKTIQFSVKVIK